MASQQTSFDSNQPRFGRNQYLKDYAYAIRHLKMGESEEDVTRSIANFRDDKKAADAMDYAANTVEKASIAIAHESAMAESLSQQQIAPLGEQLQRVLDNNVEQLTTEEYARRLYASGADTQTIELLEQHRGLSTDEAIDVANKAAATFHSERDTQYAVSQLERGKKADEIAAAVTKYRGPAVNNPEQYGKDVVTAAQHVLDAEQETKTFQQNLVDARVTTASMKFKRDVEFAYRRLEQGVDQNQLLLDIQQRNPTQALNTFNYQILGKADHSYTLAVLTQGQALQNVMQQGGFDLKTALNVVERDFATDLTGAVQDRRFGKPHADTIGKVTEGDPAKQRYAQALVNNADQIAHEERSISVRPEFARSLSDNYKRQENLEKTNFHSATDEQEGAPKKNDPMSKLADKSKELKIPEGARILTANTKDGVYYGQVISETNDKFVMKTGEKNVVVHSKLDVGSDGLKVGNTYQVKYANDKAAIKHYPQKEKAAGSKER